MKKIYQIKRSQYGTIILLFPIFLALLAEYFAILSSYANSTYSIEDLESIMVLTEIAVGILLVMFLLSIYVKGKAFMIVMDLCRFLAVVFFCICLYTILEQRATLMGYVWFSDLESGNANSVDALNYGVISAVLYAVSVLLAAASGAVEFVSAKKIRRTRAIIQSEIDELQKEMQNVG